jgi:hypothetical protein
MFRFVAIAVLLSVLAGFAFAASTTFGKAPTVSEITAISAVNKEPVKFADKTVLLTGKIVSMCPEKGCWVEVLSSDSSHIICKSMDESIHFTKPCLGQTIRVQGKVLYDKKAPGKVEMKSEDGGAPHACPAPNILVSIDGATVELADVAPVAPAAEPAKTVEPGKKDETAPPITPAPTPETEKKIDGK